MGKKTNFVILVYRHNPTYPLSSLTSKGLLRHHPMHSLKIFGFGKLRLHYGKHALSSFPTKHVEELFGYLLLYPNTYHTREKLINLLWPNQITSQARGRLSTVLWRLRSLLSQIDIPVDNYIQTTRDWIAFTPKTPVNLDINQFQAYIKQAIKTEGLEQEQALQAAVNAYQGELYEGIYADWCLIEREQLSRLHIQAMGQLMSRLMNREAFEEALPLGHEILRYDPLREEVHRAMMHCYWQLDQLAEATRQFQQCSELLMDELRVAPIPETIMLYNSIIEARFNNINPDLIGIDRWEMQIKPAFLEFQNVVRRFNDFLDKIETSQDTMEI